MKTLLKTKELSNEFSMNSQLCLNTHAVVNTARGVNSVGHLTKKHIMGQLQNGKEYVDLRSLMLRNLNDY